MGYVGAKPSEYLVCTRKGAVDLGRSGQGMRIWKWPRDSVAIIPTTLQRIEFTADQITRERIGVQVTGIAVYRIAEPLLAFRVMSFEEGAGAVEKLAATLREMFVGSARRLIANLSLEDCLQRRKEAIAGFLMEEIAPIVGGQGSPLDATNKGWGVVIDTIEIQQVRILSQEVFAHLQAPYRAEIATRAELADLDRQRSVTDVEARVGLRAIEIAEAERRAKAATEVSLLDTERERMDAEHAARRRQLELELELRGLEALARERDDIQAVAHQKRLAEIELMLAQSRTLRDLVTALPQIAKGLQHSFGTMNYTAIGTGSDGAPFSAVPAAIAQLLAFARSFGLDLPVSPSNTRDHRD
jgi:flotillin